MSFLFSFLLLLLLSENILSETTEKKKKRKRVGTDDDEEEEEKNVNTHLRMTTFFEACIAHSGERWDSAKSGREKSYFYRWHICAAVTHDTATLTQ